MFFAVLQYDKSRPTDWLDGSCSLFPLCWALPTAGDFGSWSTSRVESKFFLNELNKSFHFVENQNYFIPIRSCQKFSKQICLQDLAQSISILFIVQIVEAI